MQNLPECSVQRRHVLTELKYNQEENQENDFNFLLTLGIVILIVTLVSAF